MKMKNLAIIGATGLVGNTVLKVLKERGLIKQYNLFLIVSDKSAGKVLVFDNAHYRLLALNESIFNFKFDYAIFSAGEDISKHWVPLFVERGTKVIDNSSAFRMEKDIPLVVPEINFNVIKGKDFIIANPNCSTIQLVLALEKLSKISAIKTVVVSSYQSVSGAGREALNDLLNDTMDFFKKGIKDNIIANIGIIDENGNSTEENKIILETEKILNTHFDVYATAVRVPISFCHGESVFVEFEEDVDLDIVKRFLDDEYIKTSEDIIFPSEVAGINLTFVFRLRKVAKNRISFFVLADNLRRGAAFNAVRILEKLEKL